MINVIAVTGANSGLGAAICSALSADDNNEIIRIKGPDDYSHSPSFDFQYKCDTREAASYIRQETSHIMNDTSHQNRILINCAGVNYIEWLESADFEEFDRLMAINVRSQIQLVQELIGTKPPIGNGDEENWFLGRGAVCNIVSNASHVPMTNSAFYNASKGAMHIATLSMARELRKTHGLCVFGISPNKLNGTGMSDYIERTVPDLRGWTPEEAQRYQLSALPAEEETDPRTLAEFIAFILSTPQRHKYLTNTIIPYGA